MSVWLWSSMDFFVHLLSTFLTLVQVDVGKRPITGLRLFLEGKKSNKLAIHLQHLCSLPQIIQLEDGERGEEEKYYWGHMCPTNNH